MDNRQRAIERLESKKVRALERIAAELKRMNDISAAQNGWAITTTPATISRTPEYTTTASSSDSEK